MDIEKCWDCDVPLVNVADDKWKCLECDDIYWLCWFCAKQNKYEWDCDSVKKGWQCDTCFHHGCYSCSEYDGEFDEDDNWTCISCLEQIASTGKSKSQTLKEQSIMRLAQKINEKKMNK